MGYEAPNIRIYSNDGSALLYYSGDYTIIASGGVSEPAAVTQNGLAFNKTIVTTDYTYYGDLTFLGFADSPNATEPIYTIGDTVKPSGEMRLYIVEASSEEEPTATATITYNGNVIATITDGQTATLPCEGKKMATDLVVSISKSVNLISFTIGGTAYQAEEGMTWAEWCESSYNSDGYWGIGSTGVVYDPGDMARPNGFLSLNNENVYGDDLIISGASYSKQHAGGSLD